MRIGSYSRFHTSDCTPITMRQLESLIRLTEARAKLELREEATEGDAIDVVEIMRASMVDTAAELRATGHPRLQLRHA